MRYIRFLKPPRVENKSVKALITITSDLGDSFLAEDATLIATLLSSGSRRKTELKKLLKWTAGMRVLPIVFNLVRAEISWPIRMHVGYSDSLLSDRLEDSHFLVSAWSDVLNAPKSILAADYLVERSFTTLDKKTIRIWEETGDSIARHIWDSGIALLAYIDRVVTLNEEASPLLAEILISRPNKKVNVLELGTGCGIVGIGLSQLLEGCNVLLTDLPEATEICKRNVKKATPARFSSVQFQVLDWGEDLPEPVNQQKFDVLLVCDCTYNTDSIPLLVDMLSTLVKKSPDAIILVATKVRHSSEGMFFELMENAKFAMRAEKSLPLPTEESFEDEQTDVYIFQKEKEMRYAEVDANTLSWIKYGHADVDHKTLNWIKYGHA